MVARGAARRAALVGAFLARVGWNAVAEAQSLGAVLLREMREEGRGFVRRVEETLDRMADDVRDLKVRMTAVETVVATLNNRVDRMELRLQRIERRLNLVET
jgi:hypothetical protein